MQESGCQTPRRWERRSATIPISLVPKASHSPTDDSAITIDISLHGAKVRTKLTLVPGEMVRFVPKGEFPDAIPTRVVWVQEDESSPWTFAGLEFLNTLGSLENALHGFLRGPPLYPSQTCERTATPGGVFRQCPVQGRCRGRGGHSAVDQDFTGGNFVPVKVPVIVPILLDHRPLKRHSCKQTARPRVAKNLSVKLSVRCAFRGASHRSGRYGNVPAQLYTVLNELSRARLIPDNENHVGSLTADLKSEASATQCEHRRRPPRTVSVPAAHQNPASVCSPHQKGALDLRRNDAHTHSLLEQIMRYSPVRSLHNLIEDVGCLYQLAFLGEARHGKCQNKKEP